MVKVARNQSGVIEGYDAVAEVRKVRDRLAEEMQDMSPEEQVAYLRDRAEKFRRTHIQHDKKRKS